MILHSMGGIENLPQILRRLRREPDGAALLLALGYENALGDFAPLREADIERLAQGSPNAEYMERNERQAVTIREQRKTIERLETKVHNANVVADDRLRTIREQRDTIARLQVQAAIIKDQEVMISNQEKTLDGQAKQLQRTVDVNFKLTEEVRELKARPFAAHDAAVEAKNKEIANLKAQLAWFEASDKQFRDDMKKVFAENRALRDAVDVRDAEDQRTLDAYRDEVRLARELNTGPYAWTSEAPKMNVGSYKGLLYALALALLDDRDLTALPPEDQVRGETEAR